jgi:catechol 2,3-dioxygenase-like lactoylglutathione lyase family enzyme
MTFHFDAVFYYVSDLERSIRFYKDILGFKLTSRDVVARFDIDGVLFEIVPLRSNTTMGQGGNARLCLRVDSVEEGLQLLRTNGVRTADAEDKGTGMLGTFEDPDGNEICLWQYA